MEIAINPSFLGDTIMAKKEEKKPLTEKEILKKMAEIEKENDGFSNIPTNHPIYWDLRKDLQRLQNQ